MIIQPTGSIILVEVIYKNEIGKIVLPDKLDGTPHEIKKELSKLIVKACGPDCKIVKIGDEILNRSHAYVQETKIKDHCLMSEADVWAVVSREDETNGSKV